MADVLSAIELMDDPGVVAKVKKALSLLRRALALYSSRQIAFSFNGGKDSTVLLHLFRAAMQPCSTPDGASGTLKGVRSFYFVKDEDFEEVDSFVREMDQCYLLGVDYVTDPDFKHGLENLITTTGVTAIVLGTRRGDPNARDQEFFCPSSDGWPPFMRINPILDWTYNDVWTFLRSCNLPYCQLYDRGYTSLGCRFNTLPNRALQMEDGSYAPAHQLPDGRLERAGRNASSTALGTETPVASPTGAPGNFAHTAAILAIGDELLSGKVEDCNTSFLCSELHSIGWQVSRVVFVPDCADVISSELRLVSAASDAVFTMGGMGPTLDDVTMAGVARAFNRNLVRHPGLESRLRSYFGDDLGPAHLKMADLPEGEADLLDYTLDNGELSKFPVVRCRNTYIFPGVPHLFRQKWQAVKGYLTGHYRVKPFCNQTFRLAIGDETQIAAALEQVSSVHGQDVNIGSYPVSRQEDGAQILLTMDGKQAECIELAAELLRQLLPADCIIREEEDVRTLLRKHSVI